MTLRLCATATDGELYTVARPRHVKGEFFEQVVSPKDTNNLDL